MLYEMSSGEICNIFGIQKYFSFRRRGEKKLCGISYSKNKAHFEAFHFVISSSITSLLLLENDTGLGRQV